jgi:hypothetical protein
MSYRKMLFRKTAIACRELGISYHRLINLVRFAKIEPPERDSSGHFLWSDRDLERARRALKEMGERKAVPT